jgi:glycosyltransferase involved in cell wall biosynthesis
MTDSGILPLSLVVIVRNEAQLIADCLDSVPFAAERIVVDADSTDATVAIAESRGARVVTQSWLGFGAQRNFATTLVSYDWILVLDADERLSPALTEELRRRLPTIFASSAAGGILRRSTLFMGSQMRWYRPMTGERIARLYHRGRARWTDARVHEHLVFERPTVTFTAPLLHLHNPTLVHKQLKTLRYTELKARDWLDRKRSLRMWQCPFVFLFTFIRDYIFRLAFLDGCWRAAFMNLITPTRASWNGHNSSGWRADLLRVNGFDERMAYWAQDREFGERLVNAGIRGVQIRYSAVCVHLHHERPYRTEQSRERNQGIRQETRIRKATWTSQGILKTAAPQPAIVGLRRPADDVAINRFQTAQQSSS